MEFIIDFVLIRKLTAREYQLAKQEIAALGIMRAFNNSLQRHDTQLVTASDVSTLACKQGCSWCCHFSVDVRAVEAFNIVEFINRHFDAARMVHLRRELIANSKTLTALDDEQRMRHNIKCPFLIEGSCSIYPVRPQTCRNYHATDSAGCQQSYEQPDNMDIAPEYAPITFQTGASQVDAFAKAMQDEGFVIEVYELNTAVLEVLNDKDNSWQCFINKLAPFNSTGNDVTLEFMDMKE